MQFTRDALQDIIGRCRVHEDRVSVPITREDGDFLQSMNIRPLVNDNKTSLTLEAFRARFAVAHPWKA